MPPVSVSEPPSSLIVPSVMLSAAPIVSVPLLPISSVWLALVIADRTVRRRGVVELQIGDVLVESIAATSPAPNVPVRSSVPPEAVMVSALPVPDCGQIRRDGAEAAQRAVRDVVVRRS